MKLDCGKTEKKLWDAGKTKKGVPGLRKNRAKRDFLSLGHPGGLLFRFCRRWDPQFLFCFTTDFFPGCTLYFFLQLIIIFTNELYLQ